MLNRIAFDDAVGSGGLLARLKLVGELARIKAGLKDAGEGPLAAVKRLKLVARANQIRVALGAASQPKAAPPAASPNPAPVATMPEPPSGDDEPVAPRNQTAQYYEFDPNRKPAQRKKDNAAAMALLKRIDAGEVDAARLSPEEKLALAKYSGTGGALIGADGKKGSAYEYYTPKPIAEGVWDLMAELGFAGGKVLDPCAGVGIFGATAPLNAAIDAVELNETSGRINGLVNAGPGYTATVAPFERVAAATPDEQYDAVVTNVPFGGVADRGGNQLLDGRYQKEPLQNYFILRTLEKLKPGGLAVFITPPRCVSGKGGKEEELRVKASYMAEFLGAYRLPNSVFGTASADTMTDVIAFRKYGREALDKIAELREQSPKALIDANVQWQPFIEGRYFDGEGKRFILGEFVPKDPNKFRDVDRVTTDRPIAEIARMLKKFPGSRVDWDMLGTVETTPISYRDGDTITQAGQTLQMQDGRWVPMARGEDSASMAELVGKLTTPYAAFEGRIQWADAERCVDYMIETSQSLDIPDWLRGAMTEIRHLKDEGDRAQFWNAGIVGMAAAQVLNERLGEETGVNFAEEYPALTDAMQRVATTAKKRPAALGGKLRDGLVLIGNHYQKKTGLSAVWRGDVQQQAPTVEITADASFEGLRYKTKSAWVSLEDAKGIYGDGFDPYADPAWCLSPDGKSVTRADDYYVGNYAEFLRRVDADIASAASDDIRAKLLRQKLDAGARIDKVDVSKLTFNLFSPHVTLEEKAEFLRRFVHPSAAVIYDERTGEKRVDIDVPGSNLTDREKLLNRIGDYLKNGTITLGGVKLGMDDAKALQELRRMVNTANEQFNGWVRGNRPIVARLEAVAADPAKLRFRQVEDEAPMPIPGMNDGLTLHGYQNAYVRKTSREFGGINGFGVGLGKTFTALAATQYAQSIGVKSKTFFVVPNSVLSNWRKEASRAYASTDDCLFIGLRVGKDGKATVSSSNFDADLTAVMENRHSKIFMTLEAFERIRLRDDTISAYEAFMRQADASFAESMDKKEDERAKGKQAGLLAVLSDKRGGAPYLEDMGVDSVVFDEAHCFPAGTLIDGIPIETIKVGDLVRSVNHETGQIELRCVTDVMKRRPSGLVRVHLKNGRSIVSTHDHPFFVQYLGYVAAEFLNSGYNLYINYSETVHRNEMQSLRHGVSADQGSDLAGEAGGAGVLLDGVFNRVAEEKGADVSGLRAVRQELRVEPCAELEGGNGQDGSVLLRTEVCNAVEARQFGGTENVTEQREQAQQGAGSTGAEQLAANAGGRGEEPADSDCTEIEQSKDQQAGRQRCGHGCSAEDACGCAAMADGVCCHDGRNQGERDAVPLPAGHGEPRIEDCRGSRWPLAQLGEGQGIGCAERCVSGFVGVDSVEVLEHGGDGRFGGLCPDGYVYDVTVAGNHNFFAEGILAHNCFKNSAQTVDFKSAKFLSLSPASRRGIDAQAKAWFIRGKSERKDGVMALTATPITNSPLEMYAMLSLAAGHERVNDMCLGIRGADNFMEMMCAKENQDDVTMDGVARTTDVFVGLNNVGVLRKAIGEVATIKSAEDVGEQIVVPDREEKATPVTLPPDIVDRLKLYKGAFRWAIDEISEKSPNRGDPEAYAQVAQHFGEELNLIGHPFNLINKMTLLIADPELDQRATFYSYLPTQADKAKAAIEQFNARKFTEERPRPGPMTDEAAIVGHKTVKDSGGNETELLKIEVRAKAIDGGRVVIDTIDPDVQSAFEAIAEKLGLDLDVSVPPKLAAMLENFQHEQASPRGIDENGATASIVKQIVFCDILPLHNKIKRLLTRRAGIPSAAIAVITGRTNNSPDEILAVQDGFNAAGEDNKYQTVIANEKAEVGINLQKGTQAIHHLTIGWTPDSLEQRNGRGVRQGNKTQRVSLYYYDADGTFDTSKRSMVNKKADWIGQVMDVNGTGSVAVTGGLSKEQMEALIDVVGDADAMRRMQETIAVKESQARAANNRDRQMINLDTIRKQNAFLNDNKSADSFIIRKVIGLWKLERQAATLRDRISNPKATATAVAKNESLLAELTASMGGLRRQIEESATLFRTEWRAGGQVKEAATLDAFFSALRSNPRKQKDDDIESMLLGRTYPAFAIEATEGGPIGNEWQAEVDMARSMIDEAKAAFARQAGESGGYPAGVADAIARGEGIIYNGKPLLDGTFVRVKGGLAVLSLVKGVPRAFGRTLNGQPLAANTQDVLAGEWVYRGTADYDACITDAAKIEDKVNSGGTIENGFNEVVPEVAQRRKTEALVAYSTHDYRLPQPHFPFAISPTDAGKSEVKRRIFDAQKAIIRSFDDGKFVVPSDTPVTRRASNEDSTARHDALREFATANGLKLTVADLDDFDLWVQKQIEKTVSLDDLKAALTGSTEPEVIEQATAFMRAASPWFDWQEKDPASDYLPYGFKAAIAAAVRQVVAGDDRSAGPSPSDVVGIRGNTKVWKETIKRCANMAGFGKYKWDGDALAWNVYRSTWDYLIANYPQAADQLELTAATRSL